MILVLNVNAGPCGTGKKFQLQPNRAFIAGRTVEGDAIFEADNLMSSNHFSLAVTDRGCFLTDLASANGTFVNSARVVHCQVFPGDLILAGRTVFQLEHDSTRSVAVSPTPLESNSVEARKAKITISSRTGSERVLFIDQRITIGRTEISEWVFPDDPRMSSEHMAIQCNAGDWEVVDLASSNGTSVNGKRTYQTKLKTEDRILAGSTEFSISIEDIESPSPPRSRSDGCGTARDTIPESLQMESLPMEPLPNKSMHLDLIRQQSRQPLFVQPGTPMAESAIAFESFPCGSGLFFFSGCVPTFDPIDIARRLTLATPGWLLKQDDVSSGSSMKLTPEQISIERLSPMDPSWMIPWSQTWGQQRSFVVYSRSDESKIKSTFQTLFEVLKATNQKFPTHSNVFDFLANRLSDTVNRVFSPLDAILIELYGGKQWAYIAPRDLESVLPQLHFRKKYRW